MEKHLPAYSLTEIQEFFNDSINLRITRTALKTSSGLGLRMLDLVIIIQKLTIDNFYKLMTTYQDSKIWQDVYKTSRFYIKFMKDNEGSLIVSFKSR